MGVIVLFLWLAGILLLAYGLSLIFYPLAPITVALSFLVSGALLSNTLPKHPR